MEFFILLALAISFLAGSMLYTRMENNQEEFRTNRIEK